MLCGATTQSAHAEWSFDHLEVEGSETRQQGATPPDTTQLQHTTFPNGRTFDGNPIMDWIEGVQASIGIDGKVRAVFKWQSYGMPGEPGGEEPPEYVTFKIDSYAGASANRDMNDTTLPHNTDGEEVEATLNGQNASNTVVNANGSSTGIQKTEYKTIAVEGDEVKSPWVEVKANAKIGSNRHNVITMYGGMTHNAPVMGMISIGASIIFSDPYEKYVLITSDIETSYRKATLADAILLPGVNEGDKIPNVRQSDGSIAVDSVVQPAPNETWSVYQQFSAGLNGYWSPLGSNGTSLTWSGANGYSPSVAPLSYIVEDEKTFDDLPYSASVKVEANDAQDGFKATNQYQVRWHLPLENLTLLSSVITDYNMDLDASQWTTIASRQVDVTLKPINVWWNIVDTGLGLVDSGMSLFPLPPNPLSGKVKLGLKGANYVITNTSPQPHTIIRSFDYQEYAEAIEAQRTINANNLNNPGSDTSAQRVFPANLADSIVLYKNNPELDDYFMGRAPIALKVKIAVTRSVSAKDWTGDMYALNGYDGKLPYDIDGEDPTPLFVNMITQATN